MSSLGKLLWALPHVVANITPTTVSFTASQFASGFTGAINTTKNAARIYMQAQTTLWSGWISGTEAKWTMTSEYGDYDGGVQVAVDGGAFINAPRSGQVYTLFTGVPHAPHFVEIRIANGLGDVSYIASTGDVLTVTGQPPALVTFPNKIQVGANTTLGYYSGAMGTNPTGFIPANNQLTKGQNYGSNIGSVKIKGAFNKLVVTLNAARKVGVSKNGNPPVFYTLTDEDTSPSRAMIIPCDGSTSTYNVWDDGNYHETGGVFAVAGDSTFLDVGTPKRLDQYGDSITYGSGPNATSANTETMYVAAKLGRVGSTNGISGLTISGCKTLLDNVLPGRIVTSEDIGVLAIGGNSAAEGIDSTEQSDYGLCIDKLLAKGYGKVFCRGILPLADTNANNLVIAANATLKAVMESKNNPKLVWVDTSTWTGYETLDGVHPTAGGYITLADHAYPAYLSLI